MIQIKNETCWIVDEIDKYMRVTDHDAIVRYTAPLEAPDEMNKITIIILT